MRLLPMLSLCLIAAGCATTGAFLDEPTDLPSMGRRLEATARGASSEVLTAATAAQARVKLEQQAPAAPVSAAEQMSKTDNAFTEAFSGPTPAKSPAPASKQARSTRAKTKGKVQLARAAR